MEFKKLVKEIDSKVKELFASLEYSYLDYEFAANMFIDRLEVDNSLKSELRKKFANKAKQMYYDTVNSGRIVSKLLKDKYDFFGVTGKSDISKLFERIYQKHFSVEEEKIERYPELGVLDLLEAMEKQDEKSDGPPDIDFEEIEEELDELYQEEERLLEESTKIPDEYREPYDVDFVDDIEDGDKPDEDPPF